jgi:SNF2 family DNA or RNA helicase
MFQLNEKTIKRYAGAVTYDRGNRVYLNNEVKAIKVENENDSTLKVVEGIVYSIEEKKDLKIEAIIDMKAETLQFECECSDYRLGNKKKACKHIIAVLMRYIKGQPETVQMQFEFESIPINKDEVTELKVQLKDERNGDKQSVVELEAVDTSEEKYKKEVEEDKEVLVVKDSYRENKEIVEKSAPKKLVPKALTRVQIDLEVKLEYSYKDNIKLASISLLIGKKDFSEIKDVKAFLLALKHKRVLEIGDSFKFLPDKHSFKKEDIELIRLISASNEFGAAKYHNSKVFLNESEVKSFLNIVKNKNFDFIINGKEYKNKKIIKNNLPLEFSVEQQGKKVVLSQLNEMPLALGKGNEYYFFRGNIYRPDGTQAYKYSQLYEEFRASGKAEKTYKNEDIERTIDLLTYKFKSISKRFEVKGYVKPESKKLPLKAKIQIDATDRGIIVRPVFYYGDIDIDIFSENKYINSEKVGKRDVDAEKRVIDSIKSFHFMHTLSGFLLSYENSDYAVNFIKNNSIKLSKVAELIFSKAFAEIKVYEALAYKPEIKFYNSYFEFSLNLKDVILKNVRDLFDALENDERYYRLSNGNYISLENKELKRIADIIGERSIESNSSLEDKFTVSRVGSILSTGLTLGRKNKIKTRTFSEEELWRKQQEENEQLYAEKNKKLKEIMLDMDKANEFEYLVPSKLNSIMRNYQKVGYRWFKILAAQGLGGILADDMGLGKTLQAIALIMSYVEESGDAKKPVLVVAPTSLIYNWENELKKFAPGLKTLVLYGTQKERRNLREELQAADVMITTYSLIAKDIDEYKNIEFKFCFIDEAQQIKNPRTLASRAVKSLNADSRFALTGTPIENSLSELWSILDFIMPGYLLSHKKFKYHYEEPIIKHRDSKSLQSLNNIIRPFILRRLKSEVLYELPEKNVQQLIIEMAEEQKDIYMQYLHNLKKSLDDEIGLKGFGSSHIHMLAALTKLRQLCCHPSIIMSDYTGESGKMLALDSIIEESILNNHRILLFSQFVSVLQILKSRLTENGVECLYLDGSTKSEERIRLVEEFNNGKGNVFLISLKAGGFGLNLTGADTVIHFDPWWNPAVEEQATDRAHRIGQTKKVEVIKLITKGTIEEKIMSLHERKKNIAESIISGKDKEESFISKLTQEEIEELFSTAR